MTLPDDMADAVKAEVRGDEHACESEVIEEGLRELMAQNRALEGWLDQRVGPAYDALKADPSRAITTEQLRAHLAAEHAKTR